jgi:Domain of unknown function (DUF4158)
MLHLTTNDRHLFGIPVDADGMALRFTLSRADQELVAARRRDANRIGFAVQLALLRHPGIALAQVEQPIEPLVQWLAQQIDIPAEPFTDYARRPQTMTDHARLLAVALSLRPPINSDGLLISSRAAAAIACADPSGELQTCRARSEILDGVGRCGRGRVARWVATPPTHRAEITRRIAERGQCARV